MSLPELRSGEVSVFRVRKRALNSPSTWRRRSRSSDTSYQSGRSQTWLLSLTVNTRRWKVVVSFSPEKHRCFTDCDCDPQYGLWTLWSNKGESFLFPSPWNYLPFAQNWTRLCLRFQPVFLISSSRLRSGPATGLLLLTFSVCRFHRLVSVWKVLC